MVEVAAKAGAEVTAGPDAGHGAPEGARRRLRHNREGAPASTGTEPEIAANLIVAGSASYLDWVAAETAGASDSVS
jgi:hypothetical protein